MCFEYAMKCVSAMQSSVVVFTIFIAHFMIDVAVTRVDICVAPSDKPYIHILYNSPPRGCGCEAQWNRFNRELKKYNINFLCFLTRI